jgi:hypothetical protein
MHIHILRLDIHVGEREDTIDDIQQENHQKIPLANDSRKAAAGYHGLLGINGMYAIFVIYIHSIDEGVKQ